MADYKEIYEEAAARVRAAMQYLGHERLLQEHVLLEAEMANPNLWDDPAKAKDTTKRYGQIRQDLETLRTLKENLEDLEIARVFIEEGDDSFREHLDEVSERLFELLEEVELRTLLGGPFDEGDAVCEIHAGVGGTDAQDWAQMMLRMYQRFVESEGMEFELDDVTEGQEAGILSATFIVRGRFAYGYLAAEKGVHRLVRISPFDAQHRRQTSFASLEVIPLLEEGSSEVTLEDKDLRIDTYRSSGAGGQHVNVTDSAVRITHLPTGIVVSCQNERSQLQNKAKAMEILRAKLAERARIEHRESLERIAGPQDDVSWGSQIRSYVLAPYQMVKDHRSEYENGNVQAVLDGDLKGFVLEFLKWRRSHLDR
ncbi:peptide chain release factor 2 [Ferrithrix thermotolerans DSM 19514]|uniref:Peptide chain release factor 2 n=1 Tax=Ferrithrix thermotolerans DSM 19514 TaxID=1121881 RepID=A0A1M4S6Q2_9ACTN|nr:peptide chain release factor 2 [Ferrithrix thermotolerans]SHE27855.1 peptide chain release factor 2 [Ferrithrix thermotolerans DSM 19514]